MPEYVLLSTVFGNSVSTNSETISLTASRTVTVLRNVTTEKCHVAVKLVY